MKKRLLKDLPFDSCKAGTVITKANSGYHIDHGDTIYNSGGSSSNGWIIFDQLECDIIDVIWENNLWFEESVLTHIDIKAYCDKIIISFKPLDLDQSQSFAKGIQSCLSQYGKESGNYTWHEFSGFTHSLS